ncbi:hypothetical protein AQJ11_38040 [Streptomyces corchorusii]|uniref:Uncharacterized protein n=2 Tax=Streptomyces TaxID=1883 RepID=A0A101PU33_STRCK|nr:hypothetical protein [Streptomyces corchorusii]KUN17661.1 hypothetical protein AQJ11_38040 [Streptomyces corchorusii]
MPDESGDQNQSDDPLDLVWCLIALVVGGVLAFKVLYAMGVRENEELSLKEIVIGLALLMGPVFILRTAADHLYKDVKTGKITIATYWTTIGGICVAALSLVGVTSIDDLIGLIK